jgi:hypothetical protein
MIIHTATSLRANHRRVQVRIKSAASVLNAMKHGAALHLTFTKYGPRWSLSTGHQITDDVAKLITTSSSVVDCGGSLFNGLPGQVWRWWSEAVS